MSETEEMTEDESARSFTCDEERTLSAVLDEVIPPSRDGRLPGAGEIGMAGHIERALRQTPQLGPVITQGLCALGERAGRRNPAGFAALSRQEKLEVLGEVASGEPAFLPSVILLTYTGYYLNGRVVEALGLEPRPPSPKGYEMQADDLAILERVRGRRRMYRE